MENENIEAFEEAQSILDSLTPGKIILGYSCNCGWFSTDKKAAIKHWHKCPYKMLQEISVRRK